MAIQPRVKKLVETHQKKAENSALPAGSYYAKVDEYIESIDVEVSGGVRQLRSKTAFNKGTFESEFIQPVIADLIKEVENAFHIHDELKGSSCFNLESFPRSAEELEPYGKECIDLLLRIRREEPFRNSLTPTRCKRSGRH